MPLPLYVTTILILFLTACASRDEPPQSGEAMRPDRLGGIVEPVGLDLSGLDQNQDAVVTMEEFNEGITSLFLGADHDGNGTLSTWEFRSFSETHLGSEYAVPGRLAFDPDGDSIIDSNSFEIVFAQQFALFLATLHFRLCFPMILRVGRINREP